MTATKPRTPRKISLKWAKWAMAAFLLGALCSFGGTVMALNHDGLGAIKFALTSLIFYVAGIIFYALARTRPQADKPPERVS
jgi:hypothetical protein